MSTTELTRQLFRVTEAGEAFPSDQLVAPVIRELTPAPDPFALFERLRGLPHVLFLDSAQKHVSLGRFSYLAADPFAFIETRGDKYSVDGREQPLPMGTTPLDLLLDRLRPMTGRRLEGFPPFQGGAAGILGYDLNRHFERLPAPARDDFQVPDLAVGLYDWVISWDHKAGKAWIVSTGFPEMDPGRRRQLSERRLKQVLRWLEQASTADHSAPCQGGASKVFTACEERERGVIPAGVFPVPGQSGLLSNFEPDGYVEAVERAIEYVHAGDCFQVNIAQRLMQPFGADPVELYGKLRQQNPAPFAGYFDQGNFVLASASPERFLHLEDRIVTTRPIKGTRPRSANPEEDRRRQAELAASPKDRAENVMIVDLLRNDLGRVCAYGSIQVPALCQVESFAYVHHLVSEVSGRLGPGRRALDLVRASFPGGSVTGAPKIRAMEIIAELEPDARGWYCGSLGYVGFDGSMDTNILIRSFTVGRGWVQFPVGAGIVADSDPRREYEETWHKAQGMLQALVG